MRKNIVISKKKALALLTAFLFSAGIFLATVVNVQGNSNAQNFGISSDLASSVVVKDMAVFGKQINTVNSLISMDVSHNHQLKNSGNIQTSLLRSARDQLTKIDAYAINHNVNPNTLSVNTVVNTTSSTIHVYLVRSYNSVQNTYYQSFSVSGLTSSQSVHVKLTRLKAV